MKNPSDKGKLWEKRRRDRLKESFHKLAQLLPHYDPAKLPAQNEILEKATQFVKELRTSNSRLLLQQTQTDEKTKLIQELQDELNRLILRVKQLTALLTQAKISIPSGPSIKSLGKRKLKWSDKISSENVESKKGKADAAKAPEKDANPEPQEISSEKENESPKQSPAVPSPPKPPENPETPTPPIQIPMTFTLPVQTTPTFILAPSLAPMVQGPVVTRVALPPSRILPRPNDPSKFPKLPLARITQPIFKVKKTRNRKKKTNIVNQQNIAPKMIAEKPPSTATHISKLPENTPSSDVNINEIPEEADHPVVSIIDISSPCPEAAPDMDTERTTLQILQGDGTNALGENKEPSSQENIIRIENSSKALKCDGEQPGSSVVVQSVKGMDSSLELNNGSAEGQENEQQQESFLDKPLKIDSSLGAHPNVLSENEGASLEPSHSMVEQTAAEDTVTVEAPKVQKETDEGERPLLEQNRSMTESILQESVPKQSPPSLAENTAVRESSVLNDIPADSVIESPALFQKEQAEQSSLLADSCQTEPSLLVKSGTAESIPSIPATVLPITEPLLSDTGQNAPTNSLAENQSLSAGISLAKYSSADTSLAERNSSEAVLVKDTTAPLLTVQTSAAAISLGNYYSPGTLLASTKPTTTGTSLAESIPSSSSMTSITMIGNSHSTTPDIPPPQNQRPEPIVEHNLQESFQDIADLIAPPSHNQSPRPKPSDLREETLTTDKISECIARSIDLIDQPEAELMELGTDWGETHSPKSPISPTQMFLSMFPLLPRESIISSSEAQQTPHKQSYSAGKSSFYIDSMLPDEHSSSNDTFRHVRDLPVVTNPSLNPTLPSNNLNIVNLMTSGVDTTCLQTTPVNNFSLNLLSSENENLENSNPFNFNLTPISRCNTFSLPEPLESRKTSKPKTDVDFSVFSPYNMINTQPSAPSYQLPPASGSKDHNWTPFQYNVNTPQVPTSKSTPSFNDFQLSYPKPVQTSAQNPTFFRPITDIPDVTNESRTKHSQKQADTTYKPYAPLQAKTIAPVPAQAPASQNTQMFQPSRAPMPSFSQDNIFRPMVTPGVTSSRNTTGVEGSNSGSSSKPSRRANSKNAPKAQSPARSAKSDYSTTGSGGKGSKKNSDTFPPYTPQLPFVQPSERPAAETGSKNKTYRNNSNTNSTAQAHVPNNATRSVETSKRNRSNQAPVSVPVDAGNFGTRNDLYENTLLPHAPPPKQFLGANKTQRQPFYLPEVPFQNLDFVGQNISQPHHSVISSEKNANRLQMPPAPKYNYFGTQCVAQYPMMENNYLGQNPGQSSSQQVQQAQPKKTGQQVYHQAPPQAPQQAPRLHASVGHHNVSTNVPQPARPVNWMTDPPSNVCTRSKAEAPNPFSVSKLVGSSTVNTSNTNYCVEGLIRKNTNNEWNDFHYGTHHDSGHQGQPVQPFVPYQAPPQHTDQYYPNFHHQPYNFGNSQFGHFDSSHPVQNFQQQRGHHQQPNSLQGSSMDAGMGSLHHSGSHGSNSSRGQGSMATSGHGITPSSGHSVVQAAGISSSGHGVASSVGPPSSHNQQSSAQIISSTAGHTVGSSLGHGVSSSGHNLGSTSRHSVGTSSSHGAASSVMNSSNHRHVPASHGTGPPGHQNLSSSGHSTLVGLSVPGHGLSSGHSGLSAPGHSISAHHIGAPSIGHAGHSSSHSSQPHGSSVLNFNLSSIFPEMNDKRSSNAASNSSSNICSGYYNSSKSNTK